MSSFTKTFLIWYNIDMQLFPHFQHVLQAVDMQTIFYWEGQATLYIVQVTHV